MNAELAKIARDMRGLERELWRGKKMGEFAMALSLGAYADRIDGALGVAGAAEAASANGELKMGNGECRGLHAANMRAAGMRGGCLPVAVAAAVVCVLLAIPGILMALLGWMARGVQCP